VISGGQLTLGGNGAISNQSRLQIESGAAVNLTGAYAADNINREFAGLTGAGVLYGGGGTVTVNKASGTDTFSGDIQGAQGLIKAGAGDLALAASNTYTGNTSVTAGRLAVAHNNALGSTAGGTTVANGAQLYLNGVTVGNEALTISGNGLASGSSNAGALRSGTGSNTYQGKVTLAADAKIFSGSGTSMTLDVASGDAVDLASHTLTIEGSGTHTVNDGITGAGGLTKIGSGTTTLAAANSYRGATTVSAGTLMVDGSITSSSAVVNGGLLKVNGAAGGVTVNSGGSLGGSGTVGAVTLADGSFLKPGNSPGLLTAASSSWAGGSTYNWEINNATGAAGTNWDLFSVTGALDMSALSSGSKMNLVLESLSLANYSTSTSFSWEIAKAVSFTGIAGGVQDLTSLFNINADAFNGGSLGNLPNGGFQVVTGTEGSLRTLKLMAIPEPSTGALLGFGLGGLVLTRLLRRKQS